MLTALDLFQAILFSTSTQCARIADLRRVVGPIGNAHGYSTQGLRGFHDQAKAQWAYRSSTSHSQADARRVVALAELQNALERFERDNELRAKLFAFTPTARQLSNCLSAVLDSFKPIGITPTSPDIFIVNRVPALHGTMELPALTVCTSDTQRLAVNAGIYLHTSCVKPFLAEYFIARELVHVWLGSISSGEPRTYFEEGLAEYLSIFRYIMMAYSLDTASNFWMLYRLNSCVNPILKTYVDGLETIAYALRCLSLRNLIQRIAASRHAHTSIGLELVATSNSGQNTGSVDDPVNSEVVRLCLGFPRSLVVSAAAYLVSSVVEDGMTLREVALAASTSTGLAEKSLVELDQRGLLILRRDRQVVSRSVTRRLFDAGALRYEFRQMPYKMA